MSIYYEMFREFSQSGYDLLTYYTSIVKRRISLVLIVQEHLSTTRVFWDSSSSIFSSRCSVVLTIVRLFVHLSLTNILYVLRLTTSGYSFDIFNFSYNLISSGTLNWPIQLSMFSSFVIYYNEKSRVFDHIYTTGNLDEPVPVSGRVTHIVKFK